MTLYWSLRLAKLPCIHKSLFTNAQHKSSPFRPIIRTNTPETIGFLGNIAVDITRIFQPEEQFWATLNIKLQNQDFQIHFLEIFCECIWSVKAKFLQALCWAACWVSYRIESFSCPKPTSNTALGLAQFKHKLLLFQLTCSDPQPGLMPHIYYHVINSYTTFSQLRPWTEARI